MMIHAVSESYTALPVLGFQMTGALAQSLIDLSRNMFVIAVKISAPIVSRCCCKLGLGLIARTVPR